MPPPNHIDTTALTVAPLSLPPIAEEILPNGLAVVTVEQRSLPLVAARLVVRSGAILDPRGKDGLAVLTGSLLRRGTTSRLADEIDDAIESVGGMLGMDVGMEASSLMVTVPSEHVDTALDIISDVARRPSFKKKEVDLARRRALAELQQALDDPSGMADRVVSQFAYGPNHPYGRPSEGRLATVSRMKRDDVLAFHRDTFSPVNGLLILSGDIDRSQAGQLARKYLGDWGGPAINPVPVTMFDRPTGLDILLVDKADATQAQVRMTVPGIRRSDPAYYATQLANVVVGGAFTSRLVDEVRVNRGLSYSVGTRVVAGREVGAISFSSFTKTETLRELLDVTLKVLGDLSASGPTAEELDRAKRLEIGLYPGRVESVEQLAGALAHMRLLGMPFSTIAEYRERLAAVSLAEAVAASSRFPTAAGAKIVVLGNAESIRPQIEGFGRLSVRKLKDFE